MGHWSQDLHTQAWKRQSFLLPRAKDQNPHHGWGGPTHSDTRPLLHPWVIWCSLVCSVLWSHWSFFLSHGLPQDIPPTIASFHMLWPLTKTLYPPHLCLFHSCSSFKASPPQGNFPWPPDHILLLCLKKREQNTLSFRGLLWNMILHLPARLLD